LAGSAGGAGGVSAAAGAALAPSPVKLTSGTSRSPASSISKNSRAVNPPWPAMIELGKIWIFVL
jgi:hypothetical protein